MDGFGSRRAGAVAAALALLLLAGCQVQLYGDLAEDEANAVLAALLENGLTAGKGPGSEGTFVVTVEETEFARAAQILEARGLPLKRFDDLGKVFGKVAMFSTPMEEKARYLYALQEELAQTISRIDGVLTVRVHLVLPEQDQLGRAIQTPSASVFVKHVDDERHDPVTHRREIRRLVAAGIPNLDEERIVVSFFPAGAVAVEPPPPPAWEDVFGLSLARRSVPRFWWMAGGAAGVVLLALAAAAFALLRKGRK